MRLAQLAFLFISFVIFSRCKTTNSSNSGTAANKAPQKAGIINKVNLSPNDVLNREINDFSLLFGNAFLAQETLEDAAIERKDFAVSPLSAYTVLKIGSWGASPGQTNYLKLMGHETESLMKIQATNFNNFLDNLTDDKFSVANRFILREGFEFSTDYNYTMNIGRWNGIVEKMDFSKYTPETMATELNTWVAEKTKDKVKKIIDKETLQNNWTMLRSFILNAVLFERDHKDAQLYPAKGAIKFTGDDSEQKLIPMAFLKLPVKKIGNLYSIKFGTDTHLMIEKGAKKFENLVTNVEKLNSGTYTSSNIAIPKMSIAPDSVIDLAPYLQRMGLGDIYADGSLSQMLAGQEGLTYLFILQNAKFDFDENSISAAASTIAGSGTRSMAPPPPPFDHVIDASFNFLLVHKGAILFTGHFGNNTAE